MLQLLLLLDYIAVLRRWIQCTRRTVNNPVAWSVGLSVGLLPSEPCRKFWSDWDTVCVQDSGVPCPGKDLLGLHTADRFRRILYYVHSSSTQYSLPVHFVFSYSKNRCGRFGTQRTTAWTRLLYKSWLYCKATWRGKPQAVEAFACARKFALYVNVIAYAWQQQH